MDRLGLFNPLSWGELMVTGASRKIKILLYELLNELVKDIVLSSYWICLIGGLIGLILYVFGYEKGKNYPLISIAIYVIINIIGSVILGV